MPRYCGVIVRSDILPLARNLASFSEGGEIPRLCYCNSKNTRYYMFIANLVAPLGAEG